MKYKTGEEVKVGDKVRLGKNDFGLVVGVIGDNCYAQGYVATEWSYLKTGLLILSEHYGLLHYPSFDDEIEFVEGGSDLSL